MTVFPPHREDSKNRVEARDEPPPKATASLPITPRGFDPLALGYADLKAPRGNASIVKLLLAMRTHGVDFSPWPGGPVSAMHGPAEVEATVAAFRAALLDLRAEGEIG